MRMQCDCVCLSPAVSHGDVSGVIWLLEIPRRKKRDEGLGNRPNETNERPFEKGKTKHTLH